MNGLVQVHDAFQLRLGASALRVVGTMPDQNATATVLEVLEVEVEHLAGPQPALEHEQEHGPVAKLAQRAQQRRDLLVGEWPGKALHRADPQNAPHGPRPGREVQEGHVTG
jgi:hypothetical protein